MNHPQTGMKIQLLDEVLTDTGVYGAVVGFDKINGRDFVEIRGHGGTFWASTNAIQIVRKLPVIYD